MATDTQRNQVFLGIVAGVTAKLLMVPPRVELYRRIELASRPWAAVEDCLTGRLQ